MTYTEFFDNAFTILENACEEYEYELTAESVLNEGAGEWIKNKIVSLAKIIKTVIVKIWKAISKLFKDMVRKLEMAYSGKFIPKTDVEVPSGIFKCTTSLMIDLNNCVRHLTNLNYDIYDDCKHEYHIEDASKIANRLYETETVPAGTAFPCTNEEIKNNCESQSKYIDKIIKLIETASDKMVNEMEKTSKKLINFDDGKPHKQLDYYKDSFYSDKLNDLTKNIAALKDLSNKTSKYAQECSKIVQLITGSGNNQTDTNDNTKSVKNESVDFNSMDTNDMNRYRASLLIEAADLLADK